MQDQLSFLWFLREKRKTPGPLSRWKVTFRFGFFCGFAAFAALREKKRQDRKVGAWLPFVFGFFGAASWLWCNFF